MIITTTGTAATFTIVGLRAQDNNDLVLTHPTTIDLSENYDSDDLSNVSSVIQAGIDAGEITVTSISGFPILDVEAIPEDIANLSTVAISGDYNDLENLPDLSALSSLVEDSLFNENPIQVTNWDTAMEPGVYFGNGGTANRPPGFNGFERGFVFLASRTGASVYIQQVFDGATGALASRRFNTGPGTWSAWSVYTDQSGVQSLIDLHANLTNNPHSVNASQIGLGNVDNTSDADKPVSNAQQTALDAAVTLLQAEQANQNTSIQENENSIVAIENEQETQNTNISDNGSAIAQEILDRQAADQAHVDAANPHPQYALIEPQRLVRFPEPSAANAGARFTPVVNAAGTDYEFFREFVDFARRDTPLAHQSSAVFQEYLTLNTNVPVAGDYELTVSYRWSMNTAGSNFLAHILFDGNFIFPLHIEPADSAGIGQNVPNSTGGITNTGTDQFQRVSHEDILPLSAGLKSFRLEFRGQFANAEPTIYAALIKLKRIRRDV
jgi:hypothetical protein